MFSIIIPVYNSSTSLFELNKEISVFFDNQSWEYELIWVDDCSHEATKSALQEVLKEGRSQFCKDMTLITLPKNLGQQKALYLGLLKAKGEYALTIDDDLQHDIRALTILLSQAVTQNADLVFGQYISYGAGKIRKSGSKIIGTFFKMKYPVLNGHRVSSYRLIHKRLYTCLPNIEIVQMSQTFVYLSAELLKYAMRVESVFIERRQRAYGQSGYTFIKCAKIGCQLILNYGILPHKKQEYLNEKNNDGWRRKLPN
jgi:undecaprenyl-phosphate 4-deoxy-4-formamido-L-arabinose transferase